MNAKKCKTLRVLMRQAGLDPAARGYVSAEKRFVLIDTKAVGKDGVNMKERFYYTGTISLTAGCGRKEYKTAKARL